MYYSTVALKSNAKIAENKCMTKVDTIVYKHGTGYERDSLWQTARRQQCKRKDQLGMARAHVL